MDNLEKIQLFGRPPIWMADLDVSAGFDLVLVDN